MTENPMFTQLMSEFLGNEDIPDDGSLSIGELLQATNRIQELLTSPVIYVREEDDE